MNLSDLLDKVNSKETFFELVAALKKDKIDEDEKENINRSSKFSFGANGCENGNISMFLDAIHLFGNDNEEISLSWYSYALLLYSGIFYK
ncbi:hypothetical protein [Algoriphagus antarcticus]|uniref:Uncharacterized protein n=1 Tax=Algoriphagus antarcticus TaxID=238540 RepID=A0A3E0DY34_9BACT|nr:hypothetical protein [Algoriphagus antarcticus]REG90962.1 hypothetical protein C8N25_10570 [Algoriphagus antarcticus]